MNDNMMFTAALLLSFPAAALFLTRERWPKAARLVVILTAFALAAVTTLLAQRGVRLGLVPLTNAFEYAVVTAACLHLTALVSIFRKRTEYASPALWGAVLALGLASLEHGELRVPAPLLHDSLWLTGHVLLCILGYGAFAMAGLFAASGILRRSCSAPEIPDCGDQPTLLNMLRCVRHGVRFLTLGVMAGSLWAEVAWGAYWQWDPKETLALMTLGVFLSLLHLAKPLRHQPRLLYALCLSGCLMVGLTWFGSRILGGLHGYA